MSQLHPVISHVFWKVCSFLTLLAFCVVVLGFSLSLVISLEVCEILANVKFKE